MNKEESDVILISTGEYPPLSSKFSYHQGYLNDVIRESFAYSGVQVKFVFSPWMEALEAVKENTTHATSFWTMGQDYSQYFVSFWPMREEYRGFFVQSEATISEEYAFFYYGEKPPIDNWRTLSDLSGLVIGVAKGFTYSEAFWSAVQDETLIIQYVNRDMQNIKKLIAGRVDLLIINKAFGEYLVERHFPEYQDKLHYLPKPLAKIPGHMLFSKSNSQSLRYKALFEKGFAQLKKSGRLKVMQVGLFEGLYDVADKNGVP
ncbi:substrate-binding periplasmic protein [Marinibactrum halimedae]|uniref:substrate-binding periplasmic protein n=1 Tax=Marinibactrum halimedae TaxID=1444977 RepID=UPI0024E07A8E|nr:transporter substrate-binding domain-containing protein [Marinibactrum halimedae]